MPTLDPVTNIDTLNFDLSNIEYSFKGYQDNFSLDSFSYNLATIYDFSIWLLTWYYDDGELARPLDSPVCRDCYFWIFV